MSVLGLFDSVIAIHRHNQGQTDQMGDVAFPLLVKDNVRASLENARLNTIDAGAGDAQTGTMLLMYPARETVLIGDVVLARRGPLASTWWVVTAPYGISRGTHREVLVRPYNGKKPALSLTIDDTFNRANAISLGAAPQGMRYLYGAVAGSWGILNNRAYPVTFGIVAGSQFAETTIDFQRADAHAVATFASIGVAPGTTEVIYLLARYLDAHNCFRMSSGGGNLTLVVKTGFDVSAGVALQSTLASTSYTPQAGDVLELVCRGNSIIGSVNGIEKINVVSNQHANGTKFGFGTSNIDTRVSRFVIEAI